MSTITKLLIATPAKSSVPIDYLKWLLPFLSRGLPGYDVRIRFSNGSSVNIARNELAHIVRTEGYDEVLMVDADMVPDEDRINRIMSHKDVDFVGGPYCKRRGGAPDWTFTPKVNGDKRDNGLWEISAMGLGFVRVKRAVFDKVAELFPEYEYFDPVKVGSKEGRTLFEFYPMGVIGPRTAAARLAKIKRILSTPHAFPQEIVDRVQQAAFEEQPRGTFYGEDYFFCYLAAKAGFKLWADTGMAPVGHVGNVVYPITPDQVGLKPGAEQEMQPADHR